jgi:hypothetical protein
MLVIDFPNANETSVGMQPMHHVARQYPIHRAMQKKKNAAIMNMDAAPNPQSAGSTPQTHPPYQAPS